MYGWPSLFLIRLPSIAAGNPSVEIGLSRSTHYLEDFHLRSSTLARRPSIIHLGPVKRASGVQAGERGKPADRDDAG
ncbi:hypothetical protein PENSPDRAFT_151147 [Peniophora sp. CONT]|nr:hypothetical protein PENSPDRAFT_151147 [Peniophora sp. CONT]